MFEFIRNIEIKDVSFFLIMATLLGFFIIKFSINKFKTKLDFHLFGMKYSIYALLIAMAILNFKSRRYGSIDIWYTPDNIQELENKKYILQIITAQNQAISEIGEVQNGYFRLIAIFLIFGYINLSGILKNKNS
jgi:hypothetical protein